MTSLARCWRSGVVLQLGLGVALCGGSGCGGAPWFLGAPLDGRPSIPARSHVVTVAEHHRNVEAAFAARNQVVEIAELKALADRDALRPAEAKRLVELLLARAADWIALTRPIPLVADLRQIIDLAPSRRRALGRALRRAERDAGDAWLAIGQPARAEEEYRRADRDGMGGMDFRFRAAWGAAVGDLELATLETALGELPERVLAPFSEAYVDGGGSQRQALLRAWRAARVFGPPALLQKISALREAAEFQSPPPPPSPSPPSPPSPPPVPTEQELHTGPTLARRLLPAARIHPTMLAPSAASRGWAVRLLAEDPTSPDSLEIVARIEARAGRIDSAARKLEDLVFYASDRVVASSRAALVWQEVGYGRRACAAWRRAALSGAIDDPHWCQFLRCAVDNQGSTDVAVAGRFVADRAPALACASGSVETPASEP